MRRCRAGSGPARPWRSVALAVGLGVVAALALAGCTSAPRSPQRVDPVHAWLSHPPLYIAHHGGDGDWPAGTAYAYRSAAAWNPDIALEVSVRQSSDGVWVVSEPPDTGDEFDRSVVIARTPWSELSTLRTRVGGYPMARLEPDVLAPFRTHVVVVDDKSGTDVPGLLRLLGRYGGPKRIIVKTFWTGIPIARAARAAGYLTWGYYYSDDLSGFSRTQAYFSMLALNSSAPAADFAAFRRAGKPVFAHIINDAAQARTAFGVGVAGLMVAGVRQVVPRRG